MQAIIISGLDMWPATITSTHNSSSPPPPPTGGGGTIQTVVTASGQTPYRPFESPLHELEFRPNPFPSPEPPAPPPAALSPPLQIVGSQWTLSPPDEQRSETKMAVWSPAGETGEMGQKSPSAATAVSPAASAASTAAESAVTAMSPVTGTGTGKQAGLAHWMSVMAEHMNSAESSASVQSYAWQNGLEAKMSSDQHGLGMQKGLDERGLEAQQMSSGLYGHRSNSSASSSPPATSGSGQTGLVVPQPINAAKGQGQSGNSAGHQSGNNNSGHIHSHPSNGSSGRKYQCKMCPQVGKIFGSKADLQLHTQIHMREAKPYKCAQCNKAFANSSYLSQHTRIHLGIKPYKCEICQRKFTQLSHLQQHIRTHTGDKPYKCRHPGCTKAFSQLSNLQSHSRCHQTDKPYKCNSCYKCFVDETALLEHIPKHKESKHLKTHICQYCGKSYTQETYLAKHMQKHSDRPADKRTSGGAAGQPASNTQQQQQTSATAAAVAAAAGIMPQATPAQAAAAEAYGWPKMDPATAYAAVHERDYGSLMTDPRLNLHHMEDLSRQHSQYTGGNGGYDNTNAGNIKTSSAFSPIQGSMPLASSGFVGGRGGYPFYDSIGFPKHHSQVGFDSKPGGNGFPNQLISLAQIRNYGHQPTDLHSLKEKVTQ